MKGKTFCTLLLAVLMLGGCSDAIDDKVSITVGGWAEGREETLEHSNSDSEGYEVVVEDWEYDVEAFLMKAATGQLPTIYDAAFTDIERIKNSGYGTDVTNYLTENGYFDLMDNNVKELLSKDGRIYAIPSSVYVLGTLFNSKLYKNAGLQNEDGSYIFPKTLDELVETAKVIKDKTGAAGFLIPADGNTGGWIFTNIAWEFGVKFITADEQGYWMASFDTPECVEALQWVKDLKWTHDVLPSNPFTNQEQSLAMLASGQCAMLIDDPYSQINKTIKSYGVSKDDIGAFAMPAGPSGNIALMGGTILGINNTATEEQLDAAFNFIEETVLPMVELDDARRAEVEQEYIDISKQNLSIGIKTFDIWSETEESEYRCNMIDKYKNVDSNLYSDYNASINSENMEIRLEEPVCCQDLYRLLTECVQEVLRNENSDPAELIHNATVEFQSEYLDKINSQYYAYAGSVK